MLFEIINKYYLSKLLKTIYTVSNVTKTLSGSIENELGINLDLGEIISDFASANA